MEGSARTAVKEFLVACGQCGIEPIVGGSMASSAWGEPRATNDIDVKIKMTHDMSP